MVVTSKDLIKFAISMGWYKVAQVGSHKQFKHDGIKGRVTIPHPKKEIAPETLSSILKQLGSNKKELESWLNG